MFTSVNSLTYLQTKQQINPSNHVPKIYMFHFQQSKAPFRANLFFCCCFFYFTVNALDNKNAFNSKVTQKP